MNRAALRSALVHRIGEGGEYHVDQLPDPAAFSPHRLPPERFDLCRLGSALAVSFFKFTRPHPLPDTGVDLGACDLAQYVARLPADMALGFLGFVEMLLQLALRNPERLPALLARLDAIDNDALRDAATAALCWDAVGANVDGLPAYWGDDGAIFAGLCDSGPPAAESGR